MRARVLRHADYRRMRWKNGGGWTTELAAHPEPSTDANARFDWRVSIAEIESDGAFSAYPGCDRHIALLEGIGMELRFDGAESVRLQQRLRFVPFAGETRTFGKLLAGPVRDFNVIARRDAYRAEVLHRPLVGPMVFFPDDATWFVYLAVGSASVKAGGTAQTLEVDESVLMLPDADDERVVIAGGGEIVLARFVPASTQLGAR
ncbi:MAG: HutD family protein [Xanthomonadaceae bacterium]|nr:HutD family protein [Xanthomonadaceae bacterium]MDE1961397.1 HutD family protein [Xanthomonadaceae bacterium]MDE2084827.1 HutD family protein [Xanthomonadaceae bacterium]MDE2256532.1 HutD family protein [Xanthomonadaceae bacterium]